MQNQNTQEINEINIQELFFTVKKYKLQIFLTAIAFFFLAMIYAYSKANIYYASSTLQLMSEESDFSANDIVLKAFKRGGNQNLDNEKEVLMSRFLAKKTAEYLNLETRYFTKHNFKTKELYKSAPFVVSVGFIDDLIYGKRVHLTPIDDEFFHLEIKPTTFFSKRGFLGSLGVIQLYPSDEISYSAKHRYDEVIKTSLFEFTIQRISELNRKEYSFEFLDQESIYSFIQAGIRVRPSISEFSTILEISFKDKVSLRAADIVNAHTKAYIAQEVEYKSSISNLTLEFIDKQLDMINSRLKKSEKSLVEYKESNEVIDLGDKALTTSKKLAKYETDLQELEIEENILLNLQQYMLSNQELSGLTVGSINFADPALTSLVRKLQELASEKSALLLDYTELHPDIIKLEQTLSSLKRTIKHALDNNLRQMSQRKDSLKKIISRYARSLETLPKQERELTRLSRYFDVNERIYSFLLEKRAETAIMRSSTIASSRVLDEALNNYVPISPKRTLIAIAGLLFGLVVGFVIAFVKEFLNNTIKSVEDVERITSMPIYGVVPELNRRTELMFSEAFKTIRTNLKFLPKNERNQIISITSSIPNEGKSEISANLADALAQADQNVIILDLDLRRASLHKVFNLENHQGLSEYLAGETILNDIILRTAVQNVDIITTGMLPPNPSELILSSALEELLNELREKYDYIIIDTPPAGLVTDATILMNHSDIVFTVVRSDFTKKEFLRTLDKLIAKHEYNHVGVILNGLQMKINEKELQYEAYLKR